MDPRIVERHTTTDSEAKRAPEKTGSRSGSARTRGKSRNASETTISTGKIYEVVGNSILSGNNVGCEPLLTSDSMSKKTILPPAAYGVGGETNDAVATVVRDPTATTSAATSVPENDQDAVVQSLHSANEKLLLALNSLTADTAVAATVTPEGEINLKAKDGRNVTFDVTQLRDFLHEVIQSRDELLKARQLTEVAEQKLKLLRAELGQVSEMVREDKLTGALNRRGLEEAFIREVARSERRSTPLCVALLDLDDFKKINDTYGHQAGDDALIHLTRVIKETVRPNDVVARYGGEEFLILLPDSGLEEATSAISRLQRELSKRPFPHGEQTISITFSAGVALRQPGESQDSVIARADGAQYQAKQAGKNRVLNAHLPEN